MLKVLIWILDSTKKENKKRKSLEKTSCITGAPRTSKTTRTRLLKAPSTPTLATTLILQGLSVHFIYSWLEDSSPPSHRSSTIRFHLISFSFVSLPYYNNFPLKQPTKKFHTTQNK
jgi:hypothetical protein